MKNTIITTKKSYNDKSSYRSRSGFQQPEIVSMDALTYYDDESLERYHANLQGVRESVVQGGADAVPWEVEICYVQREIKIRVARKVAHEKYIRSNPESYYENEPYEEFDHTSN